MLLFHLLLLVFCFIIFSYSGPKTFHGTSQTRLVDRLVVILRRLWVCLETILLKKYAPSSLWQAFVHNYNINFCVLKKYIWSTVAIKSYIFFSYIVLVIILMALLLCVFSITKTCACNVFLQSKGLPPAPYRWLSSHRISIHKSIHKTKIDF